jgi:flagellar biogenesis protein FliO
LEQELGAGELWLEPKRDPHGTQVSIFTFFSRLFVLFILFVLLCYVLVVLQRSIAKKATLRCNAAVTFFFFFLQRNKKK